MKRRTFIRLAGLAAAFGFPFVAKAIHLFTLEETSTSCSIDANQPPSALNEWSPYDDSGISFKVIGIGGAGGNAVNHMIHAGIHDVESLVIDTDARAIERSTAGTRIQLGGSGRCVSGNVEAARTAALKERERIANSLRGAHMVIIVAGMGGSTGSGVAPVVAEIARELDILTVAVVTRPFRFEGKRPKEAEYGIAQLRKHVDAVLVVRNDKMMDVVGDDVLMHEAFKVADGMLRQTVCGITDLITFPALLIGMDFVFVRDVLSGRGIGTMGVGNASGVDRARAAAAQAVASPLLEGMIFRAESVLVNITAAPGVRMKEVNAVMDTVRESMPDDAYLLFGVVYDERMTDDIRVTVVALRDVTREPPDTTFEALANSGINRHDIPAFLRKQTDWIAVI